MDLHGISVDSDSDDHADGTESPVPDDHRGGTGNYVPDDHADGTG